MRSVLDVNLYFLVLVDIGGVVLRERTFNNLPVDAQDADLRPYSESSIFLNSCQSMACLSLRMERLQGALFPVVRVNGTQNVQN